MHIARRGVRSVVRRLGYDIVRTPRAPAAGVWGAGGASVNTAPRVAIDYRYGDFDEEAKKFFAAVEPYTLTTPERVLALRKCVQYCNTSSSMRSRARLSSAASGRGAA